MEEVERDSRHAGTFSRLLQELLGLLRLLLLTGQGKGRLTATLVGADPGRTLRVWMMLGLHLECLPWVLWHLRMRYIAIALLNFLFAMDTQVL